MAITTLPETMDLNIGHTKVKIRNHKADLILIDLMTWTVFYGDPKTEFPELEWTALAEYMATELEDDNKFHGITDVMTPVREDIQVYPMLQTEAGRQARNDLIQAVRNCKSYDDFAIKFAKDGEFMQGIIKIASMFGYYYCLVILSASIPKKIIKRIPGVASLPESLEFEIPGNFPVKITNHRPYGKLIDYMTDMKWNKSKLTALKKQIDWPSMAEEMAMEMEEFDDTFPHIIFHIMRDRMFDTKIHETDVAKKIRQDIIRAIRDCGSYEEFVVKFAKDGEFLTNLKAWFEASCRE